jgi:MFS superfamily sulfate permease-like transporter
MIKRGPEYRAIFTLGSIWIFLGIASKSPPIWILGALFFIVGFVNMKKWKDIKRWHQLSKKERTIKALVILLVFLLLVATTFVLFASAF